MTAPMVCVPVELVLVPRKAIHTLVNCGTLHPESTDDELHAYVEARDLLLNTLAAAPAPQPVQGEAAPGDVELERFGLQWNGPASFVATPMADGYWTPWHIAAAALRSQGREVDDAMVERGLDAARETSDARLPRYSVVRAILTAALAQQANKDAP